jgi:hypothetical protein
MAAPADAVAAAALAWIAAPEERPTPAVEERLAAVHLIDTGGSDLLAVHARHAGAAAEHAARALRAAAAFQRAPVCEGRARALVLAAALWEERLFFEVHEVLEAEWKTAAGAMRQGLQGVIQIAVAYHHWLHGNARGLLAEGRERIASVPANTLAPLDLVALQAATAPWETALSAGARPPAELPRLAIG